MVLPHSFLPELLLVVSGIGCFGDAQADTVLPEPDHPSPPGGIQTAVLAGGCFWGVDAVFKHVKGVIRVVSGYAGGTAETAHYDIVCSGRTGHAESVEITFDSSIVAFSTILRVFFSVAHDPTQIDRQGPDTGPQYRSAIFYVTEEQHVTAKAYIDQLNRAHIFQKPIATQIAPIEAFYPAEDFHQNFLEDHPTYPYIVYHDLPKLKALKKLYPSLWHSSAPSVS